MGPITWEGLIKGFNILLATPWRGVGAGDNVGAGSSAGSSAGADSSAGPGNGGQPYRGGQGTDNSNRPTPVELPTSATGPRGLDPHPPAGPAPGPLDVPAPPRPGPPFQDTP